MSFTRPFPVFTPLTYERVMTLKAGDDIGLCYENGRLMTDGVIVSSVSSESDIAVVITNKGAIVIATESGIKSLREPWFKRMDYCGKGGKHKYEVVYVSPYHLHNVYFKLPDDHPYVDKALSLEGVIEYRAKGLPQFFKDRDMKSTYVGYSHVAHNGDGGIFKMLEYATQMIYDELEAAREPPVVTPTIHMPRRTRLNPRRRCKRREQENIQ